VTTIRDRTTFRALRRPEGRATRGPVSAAFLSPTWNDGDSSAASATVRVGFSVGKACGNAVVRNRIRRRFRVAVRESGPAVPAGSYLVRGTTAAATVPFGSLVTSVREAMTAAAARAAGPGPAGPAGMAGGRGSR
jgi:ribonuclease P protein component